MLRTLLAVLCATSVLVAACNKGEGQTSTKRQIQITELEPGEGDPVERGYLVLLEYTGRFPGEETPFDENAARDEDGNAKRPPLATFVGSGTTVPGFDQSLVGMKKGMVRRVFIPWELGYGEQGNNDGKIPAKQDLEFTIKLLDYVDPEADTEYSVEDSVVGTGREVKNGDRVTIHYRGTYVNGLMFDDSHLRGENGTPFSFTVGRTDAIVGVEEGVIGMKVGGKRRIKIPPKLVFGSTGYSAILGNQVVIIDVELLSIG